MAEPTKTVETVPANPAPTHAVVVQGVPLSALPVGPPNTSSHAPDGGVFVVDGKVVNAHGEPHPTKALDADGKLVDRPKAPEPPSPESVENARLKAEIEALKAEKAKVPAK